MSTYFETLWGKNHMKDINLLSYAQEGIFDKAVSIALEKAQETGVQAELMSNFFDWRDPYFQIFCQYPAIFLSQPLTGTTSELPAGIHLNPVIDDPTWIEDYQEVETYPLFVPFDPKRNLVICHGFPANATFKSHFYQNDQKLPT